MCNTCPQTPDHKALQDKIDDAAYQLGLIRSRLWPVFNFVISQCEINDTIEKNPDDKMFAETMLVSIRDLRNQVIDVQELLQGAKS
jgi:hypothetical protein